MSVTLDPLALFVAVAGSGGLGAAISVFIKARPEAEKTTVDTAQVAVVVQSGVIKDLREQIAFIRAEHKSEIEQLQREHAECEENYRELMNHMHHIGLRKHDIGPPAGTNDRRKK